MKLSIIIPVYNEAPFLRRCLDSIELPAEVECIVIDDCSTDGSDEICDEYVKRFKVIHLAHNCGVSHARNEGISKAQGDYITFLDSDDLIAEDGIKHMLGAIDTYNGHDIIQMNHLRYYTKLDVYKLKYTNRFGSYGYDNLPVHWCMVWNKLFKRSFIEDYDITFEWGMQYGEDAQFVLTCLLFTDHIQCYEPVGIIHCFDNKNSLIRNITREKLFTQTELYLKLMKRTDKPEGYAAMIRGIMGECWNSNIYINIFSDER